MRDRELIVKRIIQFLFALAGIAAGSYVSPLLAVPLTMQLGWSARSVLYLQIGLAVLGALMGWLVASPVLNRTVALTKWAEGKLQKMSTQDLMSGAIGLIIFNWLCLVRHPDYRFADSDTDLYHFRVSGCQSGD